jgi:hypothetical protein
MANKNSLTVVEGPDGKAELFEVTEEEATVLTEYKVEFKGKSMCASPWARRTSRLASWQGRNVVDSDA